MTGPAHRQPALIALVAAGGCLGAPLRYALALWLPGRSSGWPTATFVTNMVGALVLGGLLEALVRTGPDAGWRQLVRLGVGTGMIGAFTTYSTFVLEVTDLARGGAPGVGVAYAAASVLGGVLLAAAGAAAGAGVAAALAARRSTR